MKKLLLNRKFKQYYILVDDEDFERCKIYSYYYIKSKNSFKITININGKQINIARFIMNDYTNLYDHIDRNPLNNQKSNLRICTKQQNQMNQYKNTFSTSQYKGVSWHKQLNKWTVRIRANNKYLHVGLFSNEDDAAIAYNKAALKYFKEFAVLNEVIK